MSKENIYNISKDSLKISKIESSINEQFISFILSFDLNEINNLNLFDYDLTPENFKKEDFNLLFNSNKIIFFCLENDNKIIGLYCLKLSNQKNFISFIIKKEERNKGYGKIGLHILLKELSKKPDINEYYFEISKSNIYGILIVLGNNAMISEEAENKYILKIQKNNNIWIHKVSINDMPKVMTITNSAKSLLKKNGSLQWQQGYPNEQTFTNDIKNGNLYGIYEDNELMGYGAYIFGKDLNYVEIEGGKWEIPANDKDMAIHRVAVDENCHGKKYGVKILQYGINYAKKYGCLTVKVDTHKNNIPMQKCISKVGFVYRGIIKILTEKLDNLRLAYEIIL